MGVGEALFFLSPHRYVLPAPKPLPTARFLRFFFAPPPTSDSRHCFCTSFLSIPQKNAFTGPASFFLAPPASWGWGRPEAARKPPQRAGESRALASACCCRWDVTTTETEWGAGVRPTADFARAGNGLLETSVARCPPDDQGYGSPRSVPAYTTLTCRRSQSSSRSPDELCNHVSCGRRSSPAADSSPGGPAPRGSLPASSLRPWPWWPLTAVSMAPDPRGTPSRRGTQGRCAPG